MKFLIHLSILLFFISCNQTSGKIDNNEELKNSGKKIERNHPKENTKTDTISTKACSFNTPDTSLIGISIGDSKSTESVLGKQNKLVGDSTNKFLSSGGETYVNFHVHPGSGKNSVSEFEVGYHANSKIHNYKRLKTKSFSTEKGIELGIDKKELTEKLGNCFEILDSVNKSLTIKYSIYSPNDSKTNLLYRHNMPIYYAIYYFELNKLYKFQFGFEYP